MATWDQMRTDPFLGGPEAFTSVRGEALAEQYGLCAYCEVKLPIPPDPVKCRVEHIYSKSNTTATSVNWHLVWQNMVVVCPGGTSEHAGPELYLAPRAENVSCDSHKDRLIQTGKLNGATHGTTLNPVTMPFDPMLFTCSPSTGALTPNEGACALLEPMNGNPYPNVVKLVEETINVFNLNCDRLAQRRLRLARLLEADLAALVTL